MATEQKFKLLPIDFPNDVEQYLDVGYEAFIEEPLNKAIMDTNDEAVFKLNREYRKARLYRRVLTKANNVHAAKMVLDEEGIPDNEKVVASYIVFHAPPSVPQAPDVDKELLDEEHKKQEPLKLYLNIELQEKTEAAFEAKTKELIGSTEQASNNWYLATLCTRPRFQRKGLALQLIQWGVDEAEKDAKQRPDAVKGVFTIATPTGLRSYLKAGMAELGNEEIDIGDGQIWKAVWLQKKF